MDEIAAKASPAAAEIAALDARIDAVEEAYEFMLAYAAQGRRDERGAPEPGIRTFLRRLETALDGIGQSAAAVARARRSDALAGVVDVLAADARATLALVRLVLARPGIGSPLVDNLNASIHLRAVLTDLFLIDEVLKDEPRAPGVRAP